MKLGRLTVGIIAGVVALLVLFLVQFVQTQVLGSPSGRLPLVAFVGAGVGVFWVADRLGILASAYTEPGLGLRTSDESDARADSQARERDGLRARLDAMLPAASNTEPELLSAVDLIESNIGVCEWNRLHNSDLLTVSDDGQTIGWESRKPTYAGKHYPPAWVQASTELKLHSATFQLDFVVEDMKNAQIGVGFMLLWDVGPDWGFFGYLGSSPTAWAYDPFTGDVVTSTRSIEAGLPKFGDGRTGVVSIELQLPRNDRGAARFLVNGVESRTIELPKGAVVLPAACLLKEGQRVRLARFEKT